MGLNTFGWTPAEVTTDSAGNVISGVTLTVFTDVTKSNQVTGLFDKDGTTALPSGVVVSDNKGRFGFKASDAYSLLFVYDGSTADPWPIAAHEALDQGMASHAQAVADAQAAADSAAQSAALVGAPADTIMATTIGNAASSTRGALNGAYAALPGAQKNALTGWFHADGFGAVGDGVADDAPKIQAALNAAETAGGGRVYLRKGNYKVATGLLVPSKVQIVGDGGGGQVGNATKITYAGTAGGTVISPKTRTSDTINVGLIGLDISGGNLAGLGVEFYRVSYSRIQDCAVYAMQAGGVGVVFDSNVTNQCYFNVADNVKVDGVDTGVRFTRGANANRWQGGKIGNGAVGMEFLSSSAGNMVLATDFENASSKHIYIDAGANVFMGLHMELAPIGYDLTANALGTRRISTTIASTVTSYINDLSTQGGSLDEISTDTYALRFGATRITSKTLSTTTQVNIDPAPYSGTASVLVQMFRNLTTTGARQVNIYKGDGTGTSAFLLDVLNGTLSVGDVGLGGGRGALGIANRTAAPTSNPAGGGVAFAEAGSLRWRTSNGTVSTVSGDVVSKAISYSAGGPDRFILATGGAGGVTITLPAASLGGRHVVKKVDSGAGAVTVATTSAQTIDGAATKVLATQYASVEVVSDGTAWFIV